MPIDWNAHFSCFEQPPIKTENESHSACVKDSQEPTDQEAEEFILDLEMTEKEGS